jgi:hypothetical protein
LPRGSDPIKIFVKKLDIFLVFELRVAEGIIGGDESWYAPSLYVVLAKEFPE